MRTQRQYSMKRRRDDEEFVAMKRPRTASRPASNAMLVDIATLPRFNPPKRAAHIPSANFPRKDGEKKIVDCYFASNVASAGHGVAPNPADVYSFIGDANYARNLFPAIGQGTARNQRIGTKVRIKALDLYAELTTVSDKMGDTFRISLCKVLRNGGNNGASYGSRVYGSASNAGGIGVDSNMMNIFWPRNEDYINDFKVLREWQVNTLAKGLTMIPDGEGDLTEERFTQNVAVVKDHIIVDDLMQWSNAGTNGDITATLETAYFFLVRMGGRQEDDMSEVTFTGSVRVTYVDI